MERYLKVINRVAPVYDQSEDASSGFTRICNESARRRLKNKERLLEKTVYGCHRGLRKNKAKESKDERRPACSKKDIACCYEMWEVVFASEPQTRYFITVHGHTGHDPENNQHERKWLTSREQRAVENYCFTLFRIMTPGQVLNELQEKLPPGDFSNSLAYLTLDRMRAMQHKYWRKNRLCGKDVDAVRKIIHAADFPLLSCSDELKKGLSETSKDTAQAPLLQGFHILICSDAQSLMLKKFGDLVFLDTVHGTTKYSYFNLTILVLDEFGQGFPVAFMLSQTETSNDWNFLIKSVFKKAGRDPSETTFMIDKSTTIKAAINQVGGQYFLCIFHMMQEIDRRLNRHIVGIDPKQKAKLKGQIQYHIRALRQIRDKGIFLDRNRHFKNKILQDLRGMPNASGFVVYYEKNWEACADRWAAFGRLEFREYQQDTNNLIESFFRQLRNRYCRDKKTRLDEHLHVLAHIVIPSYLRKRKSIELGLTRSKNYESNQKIENQVQKLVNHGLFKLQDTSVGIGFVHYRKQSYWFCLAELSCTCRKKNVCIHIEAAFRHFQSNDVHFKFQILASHAEHLRKNKAVKSVGSVSATSKLYQHITHTARPSCSENFDDKMQMHYVDSPRKVCTCLMFHCMSICGHILAALPGTLVEDLHEYGLDCDSIMPIHVFQHPRVCTIRQGDVSSQVDEELQGRLMQECTLRPETLHEPQQYEPSSLASCTKLRQLCWRIPEESQDEANETIEDLVRSLEKKFLLSDLPTTFTRGTIDREKEKVF